VITCGNQPTQEQKNNLEGSEGSFPNLVSGEWSVTGSANSNYNCIAWSVGETNVKYNDVHSDPANGWVGIDEVYGNNNGTLETSDMDAFYDAKGYVPTATGPEDADIMYYGKNPDGSGFHAARKSSNPSCSTMYESKLGTYIKIDHVWNQLNGTGSGRYGSPTRFYKHK